MIVLLDKELADGSLSRNTCKPAEKVLKKRVTPYILRHSSATYWGPKMNRYRLCAKYGWAFRSNMPDRYIEPKGIVFNQIAEKDDVDQATRLQKENRVLTEKVERLEQGYGRLRKASEFIMSVVEGMDTEDLKGKIFEWAKRRSNITTEGLSVTW